MVDANRSDRNVRHIDVHDEPDCRYWSRRLEVRPKELKAAARHVGSRAEDVERFILERRARARIDHVG